MAGKPTITLVWAGGWDEKMVLAKQIHCLHRSKSEVLGSKMLPRTHLVTKAQ